MEYSSLPVITKEIIKVEYEQALEDCLNILAGDKWKAIPKRLGYTKHKTKFGYAMTDGELQINEAFINTRSYTKLRNTLRHEMAHFSLGFTVNHNKIFKYREYMFEGNKQVPEKEIEDVTDNIEYKYTLIAHLMGGQQVLIGGVHNKTTTYSKYEEKVKAGTAKKTFSINRVKVERFEFILNKKGQQKGSYIHGR
jgi:predicted SprT family Zn-dependent metalloprotease